MEPKGIAAKHRWTDAMGASVRRQKADLDRAREQIALLHAELRKVKGPCSNKDCVWEKAHSGPCNTGRFGAGGDDVTTERNE